MENKNKAYYTLLLMLTIFLIGTVSGIILVRGVSSNTGSEEVDDLEDFTVSTGDSEIFFTKDTLTKANEAYYKERLETLLTPEEITYVAQRQWEAHLSVNGKEVTNSTLSLNGPQNIRIMIGEVALRDDLLPKEILASGKLDQANDGEPLTEYIEVITDHPYEIVRKESDCSIKYYYEFKEVPSGSMIIFQMNTVLKEHLKNKESLRDGRFDVIVK